jgi:metal-responsive CopG/Arc/MetJ family transcriptional regulator
LPEIDMATMKFSLPGDLLAAFNKAFAGTDKSAMLTALMRQALEERRRQKRRARAISRLLVLRRRLRPVSSGQIARARRSQRP